jgi:hypothetical protein
MVEMAMRGLTSVIVYFGDLLIHSKSHGDHRVHLNKYSIGVSEDIPALQHLDEFAQ